MDQPSQTKNATNPRPNGLAHEASPYLRQHQWNPVHWCPWGESAFQEAQRRDVPIFLSIGYSTCYWCHVMERESFENTDIADQMNRSFVCIKVDREELPAVDDAYMAAVLAFRGHGGWPMSVFLDPVSLKPFHAGTYYPARPGPAGYPTFPSVLEGISRAWREQRQAVLDQADALAEAARERLDQQAEPVAINVDVVTRSVSMILAAVDRRWGGFAGDSNDGPKFPQTDWLELLLDFLEVAADDEGRSAAEAAVRLSLDAMMLGGLNDHLAGGFHRYCVDRRWRIPHFEKMLYDQASLAATFSRASVAFADADYAAAARRTVEFVANHMTAPNSAFYSAIDAEVQGREGASYLWTADEVRAELPVDLAELALEVFGFADGPNFRDPHHNDEARHVLFMPRRLAQRTDRPGESDRLSSFEEVRRRLLEVRASRPQPAMDDKHIASWNGLMILSLTRCARDLQDAAMGALACRAAHAAWQVLVSPDNGGVQVHRCACRGVLGPEGVLEDYATLVRAFVAVHELDSSGGFLEKAQVIAREVPRRFADSDRAGLYRDSHQSAHLFVNPRGGHDSATPSGVSQWVHALLDLSAVETKPSRADWLREAAHVLRGVSALMHASPASTTHLSRALLRIMRTAPDVSRHLAEAMHAMRPDADSPPNDDVVQIHAAGDQIVVGANEPAGLLLEVTVQPGFHLIAPGGSGARAGFLPISIGVAHGGGIRVYAEYPPGRVHSADPELMIYEGKVRIPVVIEREGNWTGTPVLIARYQACSDTACLKARTVELDIEIDRA